MGRQETGGYREYVGEALNGAEGDDVEGLGYVFGAGILYIDVRQCKSTRDLAEERCFLLVGFDESEVDVRGPQLYRDPGKASAGAEVGYARRRLARIVRRVASKGKIIYHRGHRGH